MNGSLHNWCFVCGDKSEVGIRVKGKQRVIGACRKHIQYFKQYKAIGDSPVVSPDIRDSSGATVNIPERKKSLLEVMMEDEASYAADVGVVDSEEKAS
jgi:hypothetical protein